MAIDAPARRCAEFLSRSVTTVTSGCDVSAHQSEIREVMIEGLAIKIGYSCISPLVFGMAMLAILGHGGCVAPVKPRLLLPICSDIGVAI
jgi:hypothetical protein